MASHASVSVQATSNHESHSSTEHDPLGELGYDLGAVTALESKHILIRNDFLDFLDFSHMEEKPMYATSSLGDDPLMEIAQYHPEPAYPLAPPSLSSLSTTEEWDEIRSLSVILRHLPEEESNLIEAWLADNNLHKGLWELVSDLDEEEQEVEGENVEDKDEEQKVDDDSDGEDNYEPRLNLSVISQWNSSSMENSIDSLKSAMRRLGHIASPEGSVVSGKGDEGNKWTRLLRL